MKKFATLVCIPLLFASELLAVTFVCKDPKKERKFSQITEWYNSVYNKDTKMPGKPGKRDEAVFGGETTIIDTDVEFARLVIGAHAVVNADKRKIKTKSLVLNFPEHPTDDTPLLRLKDTSADFEMFDAGQSVPRQKKVGHITFDLDDAVLNLHTISVDIGPMAPDVAPLDNQAGIYFRLKGKSKLNVASGVYLDDTLFSTARLQFTLAENSGNIPSVSLKDFKPDYIMLDVKINGKLKKGTYMLLEDTGKKDRKGTFRSIKINGETRAPGDTFEIGENKAKLLLDTLERNGRKNDLVLQILS